MPDSMDFDLAGVAALCEHARTAKRHRVTLEQALDLLGLPDGRRPSDAEMRKAQRLAPPALQFVKDDGVYLMSSGIPHLPDPARQGDPDASRVVYAQGFDPNVEAFDDWYDGARRILGGDDFAHALPLDLFGPALADPDAERIVITVSDGELELGYARRPTRRPGAAP